MSSATSWAVFAASLVASVFAAAILTGTLPNIFAATNCTAAAAVAPSFSSGPTATDSNFDDDFAGCDRRRLVTAVGVNYRDFAAKVRAAAASFELQPPTTSTTTVDELLLLAQMKSRKGQSSSFWAELGKPLTTTGESGAGGDAQTAMISKIAQSLLNSNSGKPRPFAVFDDTSNSSTNSGSGSNSGMVGGGGVELYSGDLIDGLVAFLQARNNNSNKNAQRSSSAFVIRLNLPTFTNVSKALQLLRRTITIGTLLDFSGLVCTHRAEEHQLLAMYLWMTSVNAEVCFVARRMPPPKAVDSSSSGCDAEERRVLMRVISMQFQRGSGGSSFSNSYSPSSAAAADVTEEAAAATQRSVGTAEVTSTSAAAPPLASTEGQSTSGESGSTTQAP